MKYTVVVKGEKLATSTSSMEIAQEAKKAAVDGSIVYVEFDDEEGDSGYYNPDGKHTDVPREWRAN